MEQRITNNTQNSAQESSSDPQQSKSVVIDQNEITTIASSNINFGRLVRKLFIIGVKSADSNEKLKPTILESYPDKFDQQDKHIIYP